MPKPHLDTPKYLGKYVTIDLIQLTVDAMTDESWKRRQHFELVIVDYSSIESDLKECIKAILWQVMYKPVHKCLTL